MENFFLIIILISVSGSLIGSLLGVIKKPSEKFLYNMMAFAGGVMLSISFLELIPESIKLSNVWIAIAGIILGCFVMFVLDKLISHIHPGLLQPEKETMVKRTALYLMIGIALHHFPEGMAIAIGTVSGAKTGIVMALVIAIHDIPEGICTSAPYFYITKKRLKAFLISTSTVIPTVLGFLVANQLYQQISNNYVGLIIGVTAGLMIYITSDEIIPASCFKTTNHETIFSLVSGVLFVLLLNSI